MINSKYKTFLIFLLLTAIWSSFFSWIKYFLLWELTWVIKDIDMQILAWYLSFWSIFAYLIWWALSITFLKRNLLINLSFFSLIFVFLSYYIWIESKLFLWITLIFIWFFYWLWSVLKNIIVSIEISKTELSNTKVNAYVSIIFVSFLVMWNTFWSLVFESFWRDWYFFLLLILFLSFLLSFFIDYDTNVIRWIFKNWFKSYYYERKKTFIESFSLYVPEIKYVLKNYYFIILFSSLLWTVSTIVAQKTVSFSVITYWILTSKATLIFIVFSIWTIVWSLLSIRMQKYRWEYFIVFSLILSLNILFLALFWNNFYALNFFVLLLWFFFWITSNLIDSYYFLKIWNENKKEYWATTYWLILNLTIFVFMWLTAIINKYINYDMIMLIFWLIIFLSSFLFYSKRKNFI